MCIVGETIWIEARGHAGQHITPTEVNSTHWTIANVTLEKYSVYLSYCHIINVKYLNYVQNKKVGFVCQNTYSIGPNF